MKRIFLFLTALFLFTSYSIAKPKAPERQGWDNYPLYGDVEEVTISEYELSEKFGEEVKGNLSSKELYKFNERGDVIEAARYNSDGELYDLYGNAKAIYKYDSNGNEIEEADYNSDGELFWKKNSKYDSKGNQIEWAHYNSDGELRWKIIPKYDSMGNLIEGKKYESAIMIPRELTEYKIVYRK